MKQIRHVRIVTHGHLEWDKGDVANVSERLSVAITLHPRDEAESSKLLHL
jgi:hypothetical protein